MQIDMENPQIVSALVAAAVAFAIGLLTVVVNGAVQTWIASRRNRTDQQLALSQKAWADYELRRDIYLDVAAQIDCLFEGGNPAGRPKLHRTLRKVRLVGCDSVVTALNDFTGAIRGRESASDLEHKFGRLFNAMRRDIRLINALPPEGTDLKEGAFPIET